ncbi:MAG: YraN family protein [Proteobacteria bacterium]|nr:YraN family protein [Desulfobulbaceae bacterium]MBU4151400.1 YraN family protein [Pseudomonadota bacterium]MDP2107274.1 YraN family protein [Desulfobulbaceae bacterium]
MTKARGEKGRRGEELAAEFLLNLGYQVKVRNYRVPCGEVDIIAEDKGTIVFVEVKTRSSLGFGLPAEAVTPRKQRQIAKAALFFLGQNRAMSRPARFDVVSVVLAAGGPPRIELIKNAFDLTFEG